MTTKTDSSSRRLREGRVMPPICAARAYSLRAMANR
jgi:hypothetical protein